ncbi:LysR substrate-binding domain-containing protein [Streptomyces sp. NPDC047860]|uniref:LysR substrate-binding domain-containing protein n=1 Tax=Streptomyces sp. NPDC047860 TaxID=3155743 RepID=UPI0033FAC45E
MRQGFRPRVAHVVAEWAAKQGYVAAGLGVALVPALAAGSVRPRTSPCCECSTVYAATVRGRPLTPAAEGFLHALREAAALMPI